MYQILPENPYFHIPCPSKELMGQIHGVHNKVNCIPWCNLSFCSAKLGLISEKESVKSSVTDDDARKFLQCEEPVEEEAAEEDVMDADDLVWNILVYWIYWPLTHLWLMTTLNRSLSPTAHNVFTSSCMVVASTMAISLLPCSSPVWMAAPFQLNLLFTQFSLHPTYNSLVYTTIENTVSNSTFIVTCWFIAVDACLFVIVT
jgi:hypothetical protein